MSKFTIPKPCNANWLNMLPDEKGKFCASCQKTVHDFTQNSDIEIKKIFEKENGNVCGRFRDDQLLHFSKFQNVVLRIERFSQSNFSKFGILISAVSILMSISGCQKKVETLGELVPVKTEGDSTNCVKDSINTSFEMGEMVEPRIGSAQINKLNSEDGFLLGKIVPTKSDTTKPPKPIKMETVVPRVTMGAPIAIPKK